jgi:hypothetical protein
MGDSRAFLYLVEGFRGLSIPGSSKERRARILGSVNKGGSKMGSLGRRFSHRVRSASFLANSRRSEPDGFQIADPGPGLADDGMGAVPDACQEAVTALFPDMCPDHLNQLCARFNFDHEQVIGHIIDQQDLGLHYPRWEKSAKRKRHGVSPGADGPAEKKMKFNNDPDRLAGKDPLFLKTYKKAG